MPFLLGVCAILLFVIVALLVMMLRRMESPETKIVLEIDDVIERLNQEIKQNVKVHAVMALLEQFEERPDLLSQLPKYSRQVLASALFARVNALHANIEVVQRELSKAEARMAEGQSEWISAITARTARLKELTAELEAADQAAQRFGTSLRAV